MNVTPAHESSENQTQLLIPAATSRAYFSQLCQVLQQIPHTVIDQIVSRLLHAYQSNRTIFLFGNGGSASLASHLACDLGKGTASQGLKRMRVMALTDNLPLITAWANDSRYEDIFAEQLKNFVEPADVVLAISGSGNSPNVLKALKLGKSAGAFRIGLTGFEGGKMRSLCDLCLVVPSNNMQFIEDLHVCVSHCIFTTLRYELRGLEAESIPVSSYSYSAD